MSIDLNEPKQVFYIGRKPIKHDTVAGTGLIWSGYGDSHMVPHSPAILLMQHTEVWCGEERFKLLNPELVNQSESGPGLADASNADVNGGTQKSAEPNKRENVGQGAALGSAKVETGGTVQVQGADDAESDDSDFTDEGNTGSESDNQQQDTGDNPDVNAQGESSDESNGGNADTSREPLIINALLSLDKSNPAHFSVQTGNPIIAAVRTAAGDEEITLKEVNAAWKKLNESAE